MDVSGVFDLNMFERLESLFGNFVAQIVLNGRKDVEVFPNGSLYLSPASSSAAYDYALKLSP